MANSFVSENYIDQEELRCYNLRVESLSPKQDPRMSEILKKNHVTLFSNGIGHFRRLIKVPAGKVEDISIPFKQAHIADVLESLSISGHVRLVCPPSFVPVDSEATFLKIDPHNCSRSVLTFLSGARVKVLPKEENSEEYPTLLDFTKEYKLVGLDSQNCGHNGVNDLVVLQHEGCYYRFFLDDVDIEFLDESVRLEIDKSLKKNLQAIKPDSTFLDLSIAGLDLEEVTSDEVAVIQYKIPVSAWKMRYNIRQENGRFSLEGTAIIDNNTDEDWNDVNISVVTGHPLSFYSPDIAQVNLPKRPIITISDVQVTSREEVIGSGRRSKAVPMSFAAGSSRGVYSSHSNVAEFGLESVQEGSTEEEYEDAIKVDSKDVGDFCIFTSKDPISIASKRSAIVPMFTIPLVSAGSVLLYREDRHSRRPFRTIKFRNETSYSLGKGKVVTYQDGVFSGEAILENTKPGENCLLPHCLENGVRITTQEKGTSHSLQQISLQEGVVVQRYISKTCKEYSLTNKKNEAFKVVLEHQKYFDQQDALPVCTGMPISDIEKSTEGCRIYLDLGPNESGTVLVTECRVETKSANLVGNLNWLSQNLAKPEFSMLSTNFNKCVEIQGEMQLLEIETKKLLTEINTHTEDSNRVRKNIESVGKVTLNEGTESNNVLAQWVSKLNDLDERISEIRQKCIPALETKMQEKLQLFNQEVKKIAVEWTA